MQDARRGQGRPASGFRGFRGVWRSHGYGTLLDVGRDGYHLYEETAASRLLVVEAPLAELAEHFVDVRVSPRKYAFSARRAAGVTRVRFRRLARMPGGAIGVDSPGARDPVFNFEVFWRTFAERYALFELRGVDWERTYRDHRPSVCADTSAADLFAVFVSMLRPLRDGHVELRSPGGRFNAGDTFALRERLAAEVGRHADDEGVTAEIAERRERLRAIIAEDYLSVRPRRAARGLVEWGRFDAATGYLRLAAMAGHSGRVGRPRDDQRAADAAMRRAMDDLRDLPRLVVDLRGNGGGYDGVALRIAGHLVDRTRLAISDKVGDVWLLDRRNGATMWKIDQLTNRGVTRPAFYGDLLVVGDKEGYLHWIDVSDGRFVARVRAGSDGFAAAPFTVGTTLYALTREGALMALRAGAAL